MADSIQAEQRLLAIIRALDMEISESALASASGEGETPTEPWSILVRCPNCHAKMHIDHNTPSASGETLP